LPIVATRAGTRSLVNRSRTRAAVAVLACLPTFAALACDPVTTIPSTLRDGVYCLTADVGVGGQAAFVLDDDTTLDCQGHTIRDLSGATGNAVVSSGDNIAVRNCTFIGFAQPIWFWNVGHFRVTGNTFLTPLNIGIFAQGTEGLVSGNHFVFEAARPADLPSDWGQSIAIQVLATADIVGNTITGAASDGSGWTDRAAIWSSYENEGGVIAFNVVRGALPGQGSWRYGIVSEGTGVAYRNVVSAAAEVRGGATDAGLQCGYQGATAAVQNIVLGFASPYVNCGNSGETGLETSSRRR
jgi:hypothetical protein